MLSSDITFREDCKLWWPVYDYAPEKCLRFVQHGLRDMDHAIARCKRREFCVQAGGHVGLWPLRLAQFFKGVATFECEPALFQCLRLNTNTTPNITSFDAALGPELGRVKLRPSVSAGSWRVDHEHGKVEVDQVTIDWLGLGQCDAIFLDVEGYEVEALKGAAATIKKFSPVIHVEELPRARDAIRAHLAELNYRRVVAIHNDAVYVRA